MCIISDIGIGKVSALYTSLNNFINPGTKLVPPPMTIGTDVGKAGTLAVPSN